MTDARQLAMQLADETAAITDDLESLLDRMMTVARKADKAEDCTYIAIYVGLLGAVISAGYHCFEQDMRSESKMPERLSKLYAAIRAVPGLREDIERYRRSTGHS